MSILITAALLVWNIVLTLALYNFEGRLEKQEYKMKMKVGV